MDGRHGSIDLVGEANLAELKVLETAVVELAEGDPNRLMLTLGGDRLELRKVEQFPPNLDHLGKLRQLWLKNLNLRELPDMQLSLASLDLSGNRLNEIPEGWLQAEALETCFLANNRFDHLPPGLLKCSSLNHLDLSANPLTGIRIGDWPRIHELNLQENRLKQLPAEIGALQTLEYLRLAGNSLQSLPESMRGMKALRVLDLSHNDFAILPDVLNHLTGLRSVPFQ
jgi:leucine-rich repeat protein SHOC2